MKRFNCTLVRYLPTSWSDVCIRFPKAIVGTVLLVLIFSVFLIYELHYQSATHEFSSYKTSRPSLSPEDPTNTQDESLRYAIVIDCGSSGSRLFVYVWPNHDGDPHSLLHIQHMMDFERKPISKKITPGLSTFAGKPTMAAEYLKSALDFAAYYIPEKKHHETPLYILATAGMRLINTTAQEKILDDLASDIPLWYTFLFGREHCQVITGKQEGIFAWIAMNYMLGKFEHDMHDENVLPDAADVVQIPTGSSTIKGPHWRRRTVGVLDMGGASLQIAFELSPKQTQNAPAELRGRLSEINIGCKDSDVQHLYRLYVTTFLGFGANQAYKRYLPLLFAAGKRNSSGMVDCPCLPLDASLSEVVNDTKITLHGTGQFDRCVHQLQPLLNKSALCKRIPCSMNGIHQPFIDWKRTSFYGFSEFFYSSDSMLHAAGKYSYKRYSQLARDYCATSYKILEERERKGLYPKAEKSRLIMQCFKSSWLVATIHDGLGFPRDYDRFTSLAVHNNQEVQWTLGALIYLTRYFPLSEFQREIHQNSSSRHLSSQLGWPVLLVCLSLVCSFIFWYLCRLRRLMRPARPFSNLKQVPSMSYFMVDTQTSEADEPDPWQRVRDW